MLNYMEFVESLKRNLHLFKQKLKNCINIPSAQEKVKSVKDIAANIWYNSIMNRLIHLESVEIVKSFSQMSHQHGSPWQCNNDHSGSGNFPLIWWEIVNNMNWEKSRRSLIQVVTFLPDFVIFWQCLVEQSMWQFQNIQVWWENHQIYRNSVYRLGEAGPREMEPLLCFCLNNTRVYYQTLKKWFKQT